MKHLCTSQGFPVFFLFVYVFPEKPFLVLATSKQSNWLLYVLKWRFWLIPTLWLTPLTLCFVSGSSLYQSIMPLYFILYLEANLCEGKGILYCLVQNFAMTSYQRIKLKMFINPTSFFVSDTFFLVESSSILREGF